MRRALSFVFAFFMFHAGQVLNAQQASANVSSVLRSSLAAQIGAVPIQTVQLRGNVKSVAGSNDETVPFLFEAALSGSSRTEIDLSAGKVTEIRQTNGSDTTGVWSNGNGARQVMSGHNLMTDAAWWFPVLIVERLLSDPSAEVAFVGIEGGSAHFRSVQRVSSGLPQATADEIRHLSQIDFYFDFTTLLPSRISFYIHPDSDALVDIPVSVQYAAYQITNGVKMPMRVQKFINGTLALDVAVQSAAFNGNVPQADFSWQ